MRRGPAAAPPRLLREGTPGPAGCPPPSEPPRRPLTRSWKIASMFTANGRRLPCPPQPTKARLAGRRAGPLPAGRGACAD